MLSDGISFESRRNTTLGPGATASLDLPNTDSDAFGESSEQSRLLPDTAKGQPTTQKANAIFIYQYLVIFLYTCGTALPILPRVQRYEEIVCGELCDSGLGKGVSESLDCKGNAVQKELLLLIGGEKFFGMYTGEKVMVKKNDVK